MSKIKYTLYKLPCNSVYEAQSEKFTTSMAYGCFANSLEEAKKYFQRWINEERYKGHMVHTDDIIPVTISDDDIVVEEYYVDEV